MGIGGWIADKLGLAGANTGQADADHDRAVRLYEQMMAERGTPISPVEVERMSSATVLDPAQVQQSLIAAPERVEAVRAATTPGVAAGVVGTPQDVAVGNLGPTRQVTARDVAAPRLGPTELASAYGVEGARIDTGDTNQVRSRQFDYLTSLDRAARGEGPSVADATLDAAAADADQTALGIAGQAKGSDRAAMRRSAIRSSWEGRRRLAGDAAVAKAAEATAARGAMGGALSDIRGTDAALATRQAELGQGAQEFTAGARNTVGLANTGAGNDRAALLAQMEAQIAEGNAARGLAADTTSADAINNRVLAEAELRARTAEGNAAREIAVGTGNADRALAADTTGATLAATAAESAAARGTQVAVGNADRATQVATNNAELEQARQTTNVGNTLARDTTQAQLEQDARARNQGVTQDARLQGQSLTVQNDASLRGTATAALGDAGAATGTAQGAKQAAQERRGKFVGGLVQGGASILAAPAALSDERAKKDVHRLPDQDADELLRELEAMSYEYKPGEGPPGQRPGIMAQDLEDSRVGRAFVKEGDDGLKRVDADGLTLAMAGILARKLRQAGMVRGGKAA